tara:strand:- start:6010 stop:10308 length:4299 start_codon:yes stop_codon:yes gene_type:complete
MANEYLKRTPTSSGNRSVFTWSGWVKRNNINQDYYLFSSGDDANNIFYVSIRRDANNNNLTVLFRDGDTTSHTLVFNNNSFRDPASWMHLFVAVDTTIVDSKSDRCKVYINGKRLTGWTTDQLANITQNGATPTNAQGELHTIGEYSVTSGSYSDMQIFDYFLIDGQALTPDVFGFYKDGDGYMSSGTANATDFKPGQWMPHAPRVIKKSIERSGGFGVNGFYLPMNDSSNPGADFHCDPNSIIKLKGEDLPQPRNGAPTTSDAFVSQLRQETGELGFDGVVKFDGSGDYLEIPDSDDFDFGSGDFTVEAFVEGARGGGRTGSVVLSQSIGGAASNSAFYFGAGTDGTSLYLSTSGSSWTNFVECSTSSTLHNNGFHHVVWQRRSNTLEIYVDGILQPVTGGNASFTGTIFNSSRVVDVGRQSTSGSNFNGFISNLRVVKGTAVYTGNFTPPTEPLTNVTNTKLLCCNSSTSATAATVTPGTITANGDVFATRNELTGSIVLAVPGILDETNNLITNGSFDSNTSGWTVIGGASATVNSGQGQLTNNGTNNSSLDQTITTVVGRNYLVTALITPQGGGPLPRLYAAGTFSSVASNANVQQFVSVVRTATSTSTTISINANTNVNNAVTLIDDVKVFDLNPVDYSADIRGSGTNKTVQASLGSGGVDRELGGYYGSAINANDNNCGHAFSGADGAFICPGDFTVEFWLDPVVATQPIGNPRILGQTNNSGGKWDIYIDSTTSTNRIYTMGGAVALTGGNGPGFGNFVPGQWNHFCLERSGSIMTTYMNGVAVYTQTYTNTIGTTDFLYLGSYGDQTNAPGYGITGKIMDFRFYKGLAKYKGGFDVPKPYTPVGIEAFRTTADTCKNNFATLNPLVGAGIAANDNAAVLKDGNLYYDNANQSWTTSTIGVSSGKYYAEFMVVGGTLGGNLGVCGDNRHGRNNQQYHAASGISYIRLASTSVTKDYNATSVTETAGDAPLSFESGAIVGITIDYDNKQIKYYKNGTLIRTDSTPASYTPVDFAFYFLAFRTNDGASGANWSDVIANFGQNPTFSGTTTAGTNADSNGKGLFKYAVPSGFLALCEDNLPAPAIADPGDNFKCVLWTGDGNSGRGITGVGFKPDFVWIKRRDGSSDYVLQDSVRGFGSGTKLASSSTNTESLVNNGATDPKWGYVNSTSNNGFSLAVSTNGDQVNLSGSPYVAWCWKAGGAAVTNHNGSITSQVSANQDAGFSIATYSGSTGNYTFGHGLGIAPKFVIIKNRSVSSTPWFIITNATGSWQYGNMSSTWGGSAAQSTNSSVINLANNAYNWFNQSGNDYVAYSWAEVEGYSKIGSYVGNASADGPFVYCGFKPAWILIKWIDGSASWVLHDSSRTSTNPSSLALVPDGNGAELDASSLHIDFLSNGFKIRNTNASYNNASTYVFMAFAESPFQTANAK